MNKSYTNETRNSKTKQPSILIFAIDQIQSC